MKSITASIVTLFTLIGLLFATPYYFTYAQSLIAIDGQKDSFYNSLTGPNDGYIQIRYYAYDDLGMPPVNEADLSVKIWTAWDNEWFYLYEEVKDDSVSANAVDVWGEDCLDLEFDPKPTVDNSNFTWQTFLTALGMGEKGVLNADSMSNVNDSDKKWIRIRTADGYILELALRWSAIGDGTISPAVGNTFGMAVRQFDNDGKTFRQAGILWAAVLLNDVYDTPQYLGTVKFLADHKLQFIPTNAINGNSNPVPYDGSDYSRTDVPSVSTEEMEKIKNNLLSNPPNTGNTVIRKQNILALDTILCSLYVHDIQSVLDLYTSMMEKVKIELRSKVDTGASIWMMYNDGYIVKTSKIVFAFDLVSGYDNWGTQLPLELIDQIKVLFISHTHTDHFDTIVTHRVLANGGFVVVPAENSNIGNVPMAINDTLTLQGLHIKAYNGLHGDVPLRMYEVTCASGLKFLHTGDNQTSETLPDISDVNALFLNAWVNESGSQPASIGICNCMNKIKPKIMIPGHIQELGHTYYPADPTAPYYYPANPTGRYPYQVIYQIQDTSVAAKTHAMIWGELYRVAENVHSQVNIDTLLLENGTIHLGDDNGNQGISYTKSFLLSDSQFSNLYNAILKVEFIPPYGPNYEQPPILSINATSLGSIQPFFPPINAGNWQTNPDGSHDYNDSLHIFLFVPKTILVAGNNSFSVQNGRPDDDYQFTQVKVMLSYVLIDDVPISVSSEIPRNFTLQQNYPNPFNPSTTISFSLPSKSFVSLKVFDIMGREVANIISEEMSAGNYSRQWNATNLPSGIYFYRLRAASFTETKKLVLLR